MYRFYMVKVKSITKRTFDSFGKCIKPCISRSAAFV